MQGKTVAVRTYSSLEGLEAVPRLAGKYGLKVWAGAWLNSVERENLEQVAALIDHANRYPQSIERVIVGNEVLLRKDLDAQQLTRYIRMVKAAVKQPVTYADVWEFWLRNPELADEVDIVTVHLLPYWEDVPIGLSRREPDGQLRIEKHIVDIYQKVRRAFPNKRIVIGETGWPSMGRMRADARPGRVEQVTYFSIFKRLAEQHGFEYNFIEAFDRSGRAARRGRRDMGLFRPTGSRNSDRRHGQRRPAVADAIRHLRHCRRLAAAGLRVLAPATRPLAIAVFGLFAQAVATCLVQATDQLRPCLLRLRPSAWCSTCWPAACLPMPAARHLRQSTGRMARCSGSRARGLGGVAGLRSRIRTADPLQVAFSALRCSACSTSSC